MTIESLHAETIESLHNNIRTEIALSKAVRQNAEQTIDILNGHYI